MANLMQMFRAKNKVSRNAFDLSKKVSFTAKAGELLPIYSRILMQGDKFNIRNAWKTRTAPVNTAAFTRFKEYYDWYFVPLNLLWDKYNVWSTNMTDNNQVATSINGTTQLTDEHPYITASQISEALTNLGFQGMSDSNVNSKNAFGFNRGNLSVKLLHYLGYGDFSIDSADTFPWQHQTQLYKASPWRLLAYQKIYQDWYRNTQWENSRPETCNINYIDGSVESLNLPISDIDFSRVTMFDLQYANWNKDMFMGVLPNSQYGDAATVSLGDIENSLGNTDDFAWAAYLTSRGTGTPTIETQGDIGSPTSLMLNGYTVPFYLTAEAVEDLRSRMGISSSGTVQSAFSILALRQAEALQKFREIQQSNSQDFPSQSEAHFGYRPSQAYSQRCIRIGGYDGTIEIQDVDNTNITENDDGSLNGADIAGKVVQRGQGNLNNFTADVPGILMCIYHVKPLLDYAGNGVAPDNLKTKFTDYAIPEFDKTGMQQVPLIMLTNRKNDAWSWSDLGDGLLGYAPNYFDYKTDVDTVLGAFYNGGLESWVSPITQSYLDSFFDSLETDPSSAVNRVWKGINANFFKINPSITNSIFAMDDDSTVETDKFWVNCYFDIKAVRPLDVDGLPY